MEAVAAIELVGDRPRPFGIAFDVRVEQMERYAPDLHAPGSHGNRNERVGVVRELDRRLDRLRLERQPLRVVLRVELLLQVGVVQPLPEIALAIEQADADERDAEVRRGLEMVAGEHAETSGIDRQAPVEPELRREVRDPEPVVLAAALPPGVALRLGGDGRDDALQALQVVGGRGLCELLVRELRDERGRIVVERREPLGIEILEEVARAGEPAEPEVGGDRAERLSHGGRAVE